VSNFDVVNSNRGTFIVNKHDTHQYQPLKTNGTTHIENEIDHILDIVATLPKQEVFVDAGANIGLITISVAKHFKGKVLSFEPQPVIYNCLCGNIVLNDLLNVIPYNIGLGDNSCNMIVPNIDYTIARDFGDVRLRPLMYSGTEVDVHPLSQITDTIDFLKIDVEGMEQSVLAGAESLITKNRPWCWIEHFRSDLNVLVLFFKSKQYRVYKIKGDLANIVACPNDQTFQWMGNEL